MAERIFKIEARIRQFGPKAGEVEYYHWTEMEKSGPTLDDGLKEIEHIGSGGGKDILIHLDSILNSIDSGDNCILKFTKGVSDHSRERFVNSLASRMGQRREQPASQS